MMATPADEEKLWLRKRIEEGETKRDAVEEELKNAEGSEKERLQLRLIELDGQLKEYARAICKLPAAPGMLWCERSAYIDCCKCARVRRRGVFGRSLCYYSTRAHPFLPLSFVAPPCPIGG